MKKLFHIFLVLLMAAAAACGASGTAGQNELLGGSEAGNPPGLRTLEGILAAEDGSVTSDGSTIFLTQKIPAQAAGTAACFADAVEALDAQGTATAIVLAADCSFSQVLATGEFYSLIFYRNGTEIARLLVHNSEGSAGSFFFRMDDADESMDMGIIFLEGTNAIPEIEPATQNDADGDGEADFDDADDDGDGTADSTETDCDLNGVPDDEQASVTCVDLDADDDGVVDTEDAFPLDADESEDTDGDGVGDNADNCIAMANLIQTDTDGDDAGDACDDDDDGDSVDDSDDAFPTDASEWDDTDGDDVGDNADNCVSTSNADQTDTDGDDTGDDCDSDDDGDGILDDGNSSGAIGDLMCVPYMLYYGIPCDDNCRTVANATQSDADSDGTGDACE